VIPDEAVEAVARLLPSQSDERPYGESPELDAEYRRDARELLEAAAPHLLAQGWDEGVVAGSEHQHHIEAADRDKTDPPDNVFNPYKERL
jgi:hypothetical protein